MGEALEAIQGKLTELDNLMNEFTRQPETNSELTGPNATAKLQEYFQQVESKSKALIELFLEESTKAEVASWAQQDKDEMAKVGLELFNKLEAVDDLVAPQSSDDDDEHSASAFVAAGQASSSAVMQLLCVLRGFTQLVNFFLIDATLAMVYIIRDKIQNVIHLRRSVYNEVKDAWRVRCG